MTDHSPATENEGAATRAAACRACGRRIDLGDPFCRWCGKSQQIATDRPGWHYRPIGIIVLTLTVLGPLALPLVWKSPSLSRGERIGLTIFIVLITLALLALTWMLIVYALDWFHQIQQVSNDML